MRVTSVPNTGSTRGTRYSGREDTGIVSGIATSAPACAGCASTATRAIRHSAAPQREWGCPAPHRGALAPRVNGPCSFASSSSFDDHEPAPRQRPGGTHLVVVDAAGQPPAVGGASIERYEPRTGRRSRITVEPAHDP